MVPEFRIEEHLRPAPLAQQMELTARERYCYIYSRNNCIFDSLDGKRRAMATQPKTLVSNATLEIPERHRCRWLREVFDFSDTEMAYVLGVSVETLRKWLKHADDAHAMESVRFHRLLGLTKLARGVIRPDRLGHWVHQQNQALGKIAPLGLLSDAAGYEMVSGVVEDIRMGIAD
jgi:Protein of unknown function (DUF2384)